MSGKDSPMVKKKFAEVDMHLQSSIVITMDDKSRLKSHYMKKYNEQLRNKKTVRINLLDKRPAGTLNFSRNDNSNGQKHLNGSRRRILNDFVSGRSGQSLDVLANRNSNLSLG